jgi:hypothetical protein
MRYFHLVEVQKYSIFWNYGGPSSIILKPSTRDIYSLAASTFFLRNGSLCGYSAGEIGIDALCIDYQDLILFFVCRQGVRNIEIGLIARSLVPDSVLKSSPKFCAICKMP